MFLFIWIAWPTIGLIIWVFLIKIIGDKYDVILGIIELNIWALLLTIPVKKVKALHCPKCNKTNALSHMPIFMKHAKCQYCLLEYKEI